LLKKVGKVVGHDTTTTGAELLKAGRALLGAKVQGVYAADTVPPKLTGYCIINTDRSGQGGTHWWTCAPPPSNRGSVFF
jgi:hypothetical protein